MRQSMEHLNATWGLQKEPEEKMYDEEGIEGREQTVQHRRVNNLFYNLHTIISALLDACLLNIGIILITYKFPKFPNQDVPIPNS